MRYFYYILVPGWLLFTISSFSQAWNTFSHPTSNYYVLENDSTLIWNFALRRDTVANGDTVYALPLYYEFSPTSICGDFAGVAKEKPAFLPLNEFTLKSNGDWVFGARRFLLKNTGIIGQSWLADTMQNWICTLDTVTTLNILGTSDSVRRYRLSNNDSILIGKRLGLISFPYLDNSGLYFHLAGVREENLGNFLPSAETLFDWVPGDAFYYVEKVFLCTNMMGCPCSADIYKIRYDILQKTITPDSLVYLIQTSRLNEAHCSTSEDSQVLSASSSQTNSIKRFSKKNAWGDIWLKEGSSQDTDPFIHQMFEFNYNMIFRSQSFILNGRKGFVIHNGGAFNQGDFSVTGNTYPLDSTAGFTYCSPALYGYQYQTQFTFFAFTEGIGKVRYIDEYWDTGQSSELRGYIKNGITHGTVPPAEALLLPTAEQTPLVIRYTLTPSGLYAEGFSGTDQVTFTLMDMAGRIIRQTIATSPGLIFENTGLSPGIYIIQARSAQGIISSQKIKL